MAREMMVGAEHLVGHARHRDYDELMELVAEPRPAAPPEFIQHRQESQTSLVAYGANRVGSACSKLADRTNCTERL